MAWIHALGKCESGNRTTIKVLDSDNYYSYGELQFHLATFLNYSRKYGLNYIASDIYTASKQETLAMRMLDDGLWAQWYNCTIKNVTPKLGKYPRGSEGG